MNNGKQSEQLLKVLGGHSASLDKTSKCRGLSEQPLYSGGHKAMQHETRNWNNFEKCEPEQQYRLGTVSYKITGGLKPVLQVPNLTLSFCSRDRKIQTDCKQSLRIGKIRALNGCTGRLFRAATRHNHKNSDIKRYK